MAHPSDAAGLRVDHIREVVTLRGAGRLPTDLSGELMDVLGEVCRVVVCDLSGLAQAGVAAVVEAFTPASYYLRQWGGTGLVVYVPDPGLRPLVASALDAERMFVAASVDAGVVEALERLPALRALEVVLPPWPQSGPEARHLVARTLADWRLDALVEAARLVVTELVTNAVVHARTVLTLSVVAHERGQLRLAVRDRGGGKASAAGVPYEMSLHGRGLALVHAFTQGWGVLPARAQGKTVWAVLSEPEEPERVALS